MGASPDTSPERPEPLISRNARPVRAGALIAIAPWLLGGALPAQGSGTDSAVLRTLQQRPLPRSDPFPLLRDPSRLRPKALSASLAGIVGEFGGAKESVVVLERGGQLFALDGEREIAVVPQQFTRDASGRASALHLGTRSLARRAVGTEEGVTFRVRPLRPVEALRRAALAATPPREASPLRGSALTELVALEPEIRLDIRYASANNFLGAPMYSSGRAFLQRPAAEALIRVHRSLAAYGFGLLIHDAYRPWYVTKMFWDATAGADHEFVANPATGSRHNRGAAVDLTLYERESGQTVRMTGGYDEFSHRSYADYPGGTSLERWLRDLLRREMEAQGFTVNPSEWWHFDFHGWQEYQILNQPFERLR